MSGLTSKHHWIRTPSTGTGLLLAAALLFLLGAWLALPLHGRSSSRALVVAVFDRSASVERVREDFSSWLATRAEAERLRAEEQQCDFAALIFAGDRAWWAAPGAPARDLGAPLRLGNVMESDLAAALGLVRTAAVERGASGGVVRLFSDGRNTGLDLQGPLRELARAGFHIEGELLPPPTLDDVALVELRAPERLEAEAPLACELTLEARLAPSDASSRTVAIEFDLEDALGRRRLEFERQLAHGSDAQRMRFDLGTAPAGGVRISARASLRGDPIPENDRSVAWVEVGGLLEVAVVCGSSAPGLLSGDSFVSDAERWPGLAFLRTSIEDLPAVLPRVRAVLTLDVDLGQLNGAALGQFLSAGGGWLDCSGPARLAEAIEVSASGAGARALLPLEPDPDPRPARDVLLLIDGSGSMAGAAHDAVRSAALTLCERISAQDRLLLAFFARELGPLRVVRDSGAAGSSSEELARLLAARAPSGGTDVLRALEELARERSGAGRETLTLLLSDGRDSSGSATRDPSELRAKLAAARIELAVFAIGPEADLSFLGSLLPPARALTRVEDPSQLADLFLRALDSDRVRESTAAIAADPARFAAGTKGRELAEVLAQVAPGRIERSWIARAQGSAEVLLRTAEGDPLLALRSLGTGAVAAFASLPTPDWADAARDPALLGPLLRLLARENELRGTLPRASVEDGVLWIRGLRASTPAAILARFPSGIELALEPPTALVDDPRHSRRAALPDALTAELSRAGGASVLSLRDLHGLEQGSVALGVLPQIEFAAPAWTPLPTEMRPEPGATRGQGGQAHPLAPWALGGAAVALSMALLLGLRNPGTGAVARGQGFAARLR